MLTGAERRRFSFLAAANAIISLADIASLALLLAVLDFYTAESSRVGQLLPSALADKDAPWMALSFLGLFLLKHVAAYFVYATQAHFVYRVASRISRNQLLRYLDSEYSEYVTVDSAAQNHRISHQPVEFAHYVLSGFQQFFTEAILSLLAVAAILAFNARLFLVLILLLLPPVLIAAYLGRKRLRSARAHVKTDAEMAMQYLQESLHGFIESRVYRKKGFLTDRYYRHQRRLNDHLAGLQVAQWIPSRLVEVFAVAGLFLLMLINRYYGDFVDAISIGAFVAAAYKIIPGIGRMSHLSAQIQTYGYTAKSLSQEVQQSADDSTNGASPIRSISFRDVSFQHSGKPVLQRFNLRLGKGDFVCISAESGRGKTTVLNLLLGFLSPDVGDILINDRIADAKERTGWQSRMAYVKQQSFLLHDSIRNNITLSEEAGDAAKLDYAVMHAGLQPFIDSFPAGIDRVISDSGRNISGGQRQRIAIARALYKDADVIILDEPFNELDKASEAALLAQFREIADSGRIVILVSHSGLGEGYCSKTVSIDG